MSSRLPSVVLSAAFALCVSDASPVLAQSDADPDQPAGLQPVPEPPEIPNRVRSGETLEPEVTIRREEKKLIREYRLNGRLYAVRIEPGVGPGYWLLDADGDGRLETRRRELGPDFVIPGWVLFSW